MRKIILAAIILFTQIAYAATGCSDLVYGAFPKTGEQHTIICKAGFVIGYSQDMKAPLWVAERLDPAIIAKQTIDKRGAFHKDLSISAARQPSNSDFIDTGFDKGHMVPFEDMSFSPESAYDSMSLTNVVPQNYANNRGAWKSLEMKARKLATKGTIYIISGPIYEGRIDTIGRGAIPIPTALFKIIIDPVSKTSRTYIIPNTPVAAHELGQYVKTRKEVLQRAKIDTTPDSKLVDK